MWQKFIINHQQYVADLATAISVEANSKPLYG